MEDRLYCASKGSDSVCKCIVRLVWNCDRCKFKMLWLFLSRASSVASDRPVGQQAQLERQHFPAPVPAVAVHCRHSQRAAAEWSATDWRSGRRSTRLWRRDDELSAQARTWRRRRRGPATGGVQRRPAQTRARWKISDAARLATQVRTRIAERCRRFSLAYCTYPTLCVGLFYSAHKLWYRRRKSCFRL